MVVAPTRQSGARSAAATSRRSRSTAPASCSRDGGHRTGDGHAAPHRQGAGRARRAVLRRRGDDAVRAVAGGALGGDLRGRPRRPRAGPDPGPPRPRAAPGRLAAPSSSTPDRLRRRSTTRSRRVHVHHAPCCPSWCWAELPAGTHVLDDDPRPRRGRRPVRRALRRGHLAAIGLIGSSAKWAPVPRRSLAADGHAGGIWPASPTPSGCPSSPARSRRPSRSASRPNCVPRASSSRAAARRRCRARTQPGRTGDHLPRPPSSTPPTTRSPAALRAEHDAGLVGRRRASSSTAARTPTCAPRTRTTSVVDLRERRAAARASSTPTSTSRRCG